MRRSPYTISTELLVTRFGTTEHRRRLLSGLLEYRKAMHEAGVREGFQWINGSFVQDVENFGDDPQSGSPEGRRTRNPRDADAVTFCHLPEGEDQKSFDREHGALFERRSVKEKYGIDSYPVILNKDDPRRMIREAIYWYSVWSHTRSGIWKGYLEVLLDREQDERASGLLPETRKRREGQ